MANLPGTRIRNNGVFGNITDNPLAIGATSFNSPGLANLGVVSGDHAIVTLDPLRQYGAPEIVMITSHTGSATVATITRGMYGTIARAHTVGTLWANAPVTEDFFVEVTSSTRPADPYRGQVIFETDSNSFVARETSDVWQTAVRLGAWLSWTPAITASTTPPTLGAASITTGKYTRTGRTISGWAHIQFGTSGAAAGTGNYFFSLPVPPLAPASGVATLGNAMIQDDGTQRYFSSLYIDPAFSSTSAVAVWHASNTVVVAGATAPMTWTINDRIWYGFTYEAAS